MKHLILKLSIVLIIFSSCEKDTSFQKDNNSIIDIEQLTTKALSSNLSQDELTKITETYKNLNEHQVKIFFNFRDELLLKDMSQKDIDEFENNNIKAIREAIFNKSHILFNKPINKLNNDEIVSLFKSNDMKIEDETNYQMWCPTASYLLSTCESFVYDTDCIGYMRYGTPDDPSDCDYEYRFSGNKTVVIGLNWFTQQLIREWGDCGIARRYDYDNNQTKLLFGNRGVWFWLGFPSLGTDTIKMND